MLRYKILTSENNKEINLSLNTSDIDKRNINEAELFDGIINDNLNYEKESYKPTVDYKTYFKFYNNGYLPDFNYAGFNMVDDIKKNVFKKSMFLFEFYDSFNNVRRFSETLSVYPNTKNKKGSDSIIVNNVIVASSTYTINNILNEMFLIYNYRDFNRFKNIKVDSTGKKYCSMKIKVMFLNAKTGKVHYFITDKENTTNVLLAEDFKEDMYYQEIRFFENYTYNFYSYDKVATNIYFKELVIK